ncbi:hypothetical protein TESG_08658 [Trichophyton tonsurans CBS 112818]|uniref:Uncharacterized protein n=1 Tax=Trichophyton tonsurans (strain CBS 112818) TaxID=647933 RepID=F2SAH0_TRIT1|nr:hypothetical protein TESG_08658 [Trichophyton tonsurans CBS 112818]
MQLSTILERRPLNNYTRSIYKDISKDFSIDIAKLAKEEYLELPFRLILSLPKIASIRCLNRLELLFLLLLEIDKLKDIRNTLEARLRLLKNKGPK